MNNDIGPNDEEEAGNMAISGEPQVFLFQGGSWEKKLLNKRAKSLAVFSI